jgi:hypothetical protein
MGDQTHCHGDIETVLRKEASHIPLTIPRNAGFSAGVLRRHEVEEAENKKEDESDKKKLLTFHCVVPRKTEADD